MIQFDTTNLQSVPSAHGLSTSEMALFEGKGKIMRHRKFYSTNDINETEIAKLLDLVAKKTASCH